MKVVVEKHALAIRWFHWVNFPVLSLMIWSGMCIYWANGLLYVLYTIFSGVWRYLLPTRHSFKEAIQVTLYDLGIRKEHPPVRKFNGAQQIAYTSVVLKPLARRLWCAASDALRCCPATGPVRRRSAGAWPAR